MLSFFKKQGKIEDEMPNDLLQQATQIGYRFGVKLGVGSFGSAYKCYLVDHEGNTSGEYMAVKHLNLERLYEPKYRNARTARDFEIIEEQKRAEGELLNQSAWRRFKTQMGFGRRDYDYQVEATPPDLKALEMTGSQVRNEINALNRTNHPNVVGMLNVLSFEDTRTGSQNPNARHVMVFMEMANGDMFDLVHKHHNERSIPEEEVRDYSAQMARGLAHIHAQGIAHLDLKPENVLAFKDANSPHRLMLKITDFGLSMLFSGSDEGKTNDYFGGTPIYTDPIITIIKRNPRNPTKFNAYKLDIWSYGIIVYQMIVGMGFFRTFFDPLHKTQVYNTKFNLGQALIDELVKRNVSADIQDFLTNVFTLSQDTRYTAAQCCLHQWLSGELVQQRERAPSFNG